VPVPEALLGEVADLVPLEDRHRDRRVFPGITDSRVRDHMYRACRNAAIVAYSPHDLHDRCVSLWIAQGVDPVQAKTWAGHAKASMTLDAYAHVNIDPRADEWADFSRVAYTERSAGVVSCGRRAPRMAAIRLRDSRPRFKKASGTRC
jgi:integrase